jgi:hypothetical protein
VLHVGLSRHSGTHHRWNADAFCNFLRIHAVARIGIEPYDSSPERNSDICAGLGTPPAPDYLFIPGCAMCAVLSEPTDRVFTARSIYPWWFEREDPISLGGVGERYLPNVHRASMSR